MRLSYYARTIREEIGCGPREAQLLEEIIRRHVLHTATLDWLDIDQFTSAAWDALDILTDFRNAGDMPDEWGRFLNGEEVAL